MPGLERPQIQHVVDERLHELELAVHDLAVLDGFWHLVEVDRHVAQDCDDALEEEQYREQRRPHLVAECRREILRLLITLLFFPLNHI